MERKSVGGSAGGTSRQVTGAHVQLNKATVGANTVLRQIAAQTQPVDGGRAS